MQPSLIELIAGVLNVSPDQLSMESGPKNVPKWDSLAHVTIAAAVEQTYDVVLTMPEILSIRTIASLQEVLQKHGVALSAGNSAI
jgi:acyl carrier protein